MQQAERIFRVFVSSTFEDLEEERKRLHEEIFPRMRTFCWERGTRFQAIGLRSQASTASLRSGYWPGSGYPGTTCWS
jgi:hypothetical protein